MKTLIKNGTLVTASESYVADLLMEDGKIALRVSVKERDEAVLTAAWVQVS